MGTIKRQAHVILCSQWLIISATMPLKTFLNHLPSHYDHPE